MKDIDDQIIWEYLFYVIFRQNFDTYFLCISHCRVLTLQNHCNLHSFWFFTTRFISAQWFDCVVLVASNSYQQLNSFILFKAKWTDSLVIVCEKNVFFWVFAFDWMHWILSFSLHHLVTVGVKWNTPFHLSVTCFTSFPKMNMHYFQSWLFSSIIWQLNVDVLQWSFMYIITYVFLFVFLRLNCGYLKWAREKFVVKICLASTSRS